MMIEKFGEAYGVDVLHAWGMTEMSPLGSVCSLKPEKLGAEGALLYDVKATQGHAPFTVEMKITDDAGKPLPWDGKTFGRLKVRGPSIARAYYRNDENVLDGEGYFDTGDVSTIDEHGYMTITDRSKDVIKSGGEWISSIEIENLAVGHADVAEAAVIGVSHPKWDERPLLIVVPKEGRTVDRDAMLSFLSGKIARWWMPDDVVSVAEIPHTATGKIKKSALREKFADYRLPGV
jgi:fatty-acyl-CoA synthase